MDHKPAMEPLKTNPNIDVEANIGLQEPVTIQSFAAENLDDAPKCKAMIQRWYQRLLDVGVEGNGIRPVPLEDRTGTQYNNLFTVFFTCLLSILPVPTGALGTAVYGLKLRDVSLITLFFSIVTCIPPAVIGIGGCKTGMRQMIQARYSFGLIFVVIPLIFNAGTITGFTIVGSIVSGQAIAAVNQNAHVSVNVGIAIVCVLSFITSVFGYRAIHIWQRWQWIPSLVSITVAVGCGGKHLANQAEREPATVQSVITYGSLMAGYFLTFGGTASDFSTYHSPKASKSKIFACIYFGLLTPSVPLLVLGAAIGGALPNVESWQGAWDAFGVGGVMAEMLKPAGGFGKFVLVILALSTVGNMVMSFYSIALCLQMMLPAFVRIPRVLFIVVTMTIMVPMAIYSAADWETSLENFLALTGYWAGCFDAVMLDELVIFRRMNFDSFNPSVWDKRRELPPGIAAIGACLVSMSLIIPSMNTAWYIGPIGARIGDLGFVMGFFLAAVVYVPFRFAEIKWKGHV